MYLNNLQREYHTKIICSRSGKFYIALNIIHVLIILGGILYPFLIHMKTNIKSEKYNTNRDIINELINNKNIINEIKKDVFTEGTILEELETLTLLDKNSKDYKDLYNKIIQVGEYDNITYDNKNWETPINVYPKK